MQTQTAIHRTLRRSSPYSRYGRHFPRSRAACGVGDALIMLAAVAAIFLSVLTPALAESAPPATGPVHVVEVKGVIGVGTSEYIARALQRARDGGARLVVIRLDTPGGLVSSLREIVSAMLASPIPVAVFVSPPGARAASAGTYMMYAAQVAAMSPATHLGAATPISIGSPIGPATPQGEKDAKKDSDKDGLSASERKSVNDAVAYIRGLAQMRGRNADWAERAVRSAATLTATEALKEGVIDVIADDVPDLLAKIDGRIVRAGGVERSLTTKGAPTVTVEPDWRLRLISVIGDPTIAYLLLLAGIYGILFEFWSPGAVAPGVIGSISLLLGLGGLSVLPVDYAGLGLILLGMAMMAIEVFVPGMGAVGLGGLASFVAGSLFLFDTDAASGIEFGVAWPVVAGAALVSVLFFTLAVSLAWRARRRPVVSGRELMIGGQGKVLSWSGQSGTVGIAGEIWSARAATPLYPNDSVRVVDLDGLTLVVEAGPGARR